MKHWQFVKQTCLKAHFSEGNGARFTLFFLIGFFFTSPFWLNSEVFVGSTDNFFHMFPNLWFSHNAIQNGGLGLWNPYILSGVDFTSSSHNHFYNPLNWPLLLVPAQWAHYVLTLRYFFEISFIGVFAFLFLKIETNHPAWATWGALSYQLGGFTLFASTTYPSVHLQMTLPLVAFLIWSLDRRSSALNFLYLTLTLTFIALSMNITYVFSTAISILILLIYRYRFNVLLFWKHSEIKIVWCSIISAIMLTAWRWLPIAYSLFFEGTRLGKSNLRIGASRIYLAAQAGIEEIFGNTISESVPFFGAIRDSGHAQFHGVPYFGVAVYLLFFLGLFYFRKSLFWGSWVVIAACWQLELPPIVGILDFIFYPLIHTVVPKLMIPLPLTLVAVRGAIELEKTDQIRFPQLLKWVAWIAVITLAVGYFPWNSLYNWLLAYRYAAIIVGILLFLMLSCVHQNKRSMFHKTFLLTLVSLITILFLYKVAEKPGNWNDLYFRSSFLYILQSLLAGLALAWLTFKFPQKFIFAKLFIFLILLYILLHRPVDMGHLDTKALSIISCLSVLKFCVFSYLFNFFIQFDFIQKTSFTRSQFLVLALTGLLLIDLLPYNRNFSRQVTNFFQNGRWHYHYDSSSFSNSYDSMTRKLDFTDYRLNNAHQVLEITTGPLESNIPMVYGARMAAGLNSDIPLRLLKLVQVFQPEINTDSYIPTFLNNSRLLDLLGIKFDVDSNNNLTERPTALSRFMFFSHAENVDNMDKYPDRMRDPLWDPLTTLLINNKSLTSWNEERVAAKKLNYKSLNTENLIVELDAPSPGYVFFGDGYNKNWTAKVNGVPAAIELANLNFMAIPLLKSGPHKIELIYKPRLFFNALYISLTSLLLWLVTLICMLRFRL